MYTEGIDLILKVILIEARHMDIECHSREQLNNSLRDGIKLCIGFFPLLSLQSCPDLTERCSWIFQKICSGCQLFKVSVTSMHIVKFLHLDMLIGRNTLMRPKAMKLPAKSNLELSSFSPPCCNGHRAMIVTYKL